MFSYSNNSTWLSNTYTQEVGDSNWSQYQVQITNSTAPLSIKSANTTATSLALRTVGVVSAGDGLILSTDGSNLKIGNTGAVTAGAASTSFTLIPEKTVAQSTSLPTPPASIAGQPMKISPDGKLFWRCNGTNIIEYSMSTPNDPNTATPTGKSIAGNSGFDISYDGKYLFYVYATANIGRKTLTIPWDVSSASSALALTGSSIITGTYLTLANCRTLRISRDGTKIFWLRNGTSGTGAIYSASFGRPFDPTSLLNTVVQGAVISANPGSMDISDDGKKWTFYDYGTLVDSGSPNISTGKIIQYTASTPWDISTLTLTSTFTTGNVLYNVAAAVGGFVSNDGTQTTIMMNSSYATYASDINIHQTIDISSFGLSAAPTLAYIKTPNVAVAAANSSSKISLFNSSLYLEAANTTSVTVGHAQSNVISSSDTLLLNGTTLVTMNTVAETVNSTISTTVLGSATYGLQSLNVGLDLDKIYSMKFSPDGFRVFLAGYSTALGWGVFKYTLSTAWDISTGSLLNNSSDFYKWTISTSTQAITADFKPDGKKMFLAVNPVSTAQTVYEFSLSIAWDLSTVSATATSTVAVGSTYNSVYLRSGRFNASGTQYYVLQDEIVSAVQASRISYFTVSTPYTLSTASGVSYKGTSTYCGGGMGVIIPGGTKFLNGGYGGGTANTYNYVNLTSSNDISTMLDPNSQSVQVTGLPAPLNTGLLRAIDFSADGTRMYVTKSDSTSIYQLNMPFVSVNKYVCTIPTQASAPTSVALPDRSVTANLTPTLVSGNIVSTGNITSTNSRAIAFKITNTGPIANVTNATINLWK